MKTYLVQLDDHDDILSARDKVSWSKAQRVLVVWPRRGHVLERRVDLLLLLRHCQGLGAQLALVTRSEAVLNNARDLGIPVFSSAVKAQQAAWRRPRALKKNLSVDRRPAAANDLRDRRMALARERMEGSLALRTWPARAAVFAAGVLAFLALALFFAPGARLTISPLRADQQVMVPVRADPSIPAPNPSGGLPALAISVVVEGGETAPATGRVQVPDAFATGEVVLTNLTDSPVDIDAGTIVLSSGEPVIRYTVTRGVTVPAGPAKTVTAPVRALAAGVSGNLAAGQVRAMEGPNGLRVSVDNPAPLRGGSDRPAPAPSAADYRKVREALLEDLRANALDEIRGRVAEGQLLLPASLRLVEVLDEGQDPPAGSPAGQAKLTLRVEFEAWTVRETDILAVAQAALDANVAAGYRPVSGSLAYQFVDEPARAQDGAGDASLRWTVKAWRSLEAEWSEAALISAVRGRSAQAARQIVQNSLALSAAPSVEISPSWWRTMPFLPSRITVVQQ